MLVVHLHLVQWAEMNFNLHGLEHWSTMWQRNKANQAISGLSLPVQIPEELCESVAMDPITHLPETMNGIQLLQSWWADLFKMVWIIPAETSISVIEYAYLFARKIFMEHG